MAFHSSALRLLGLGAALLMAVPAQGQRQDFEYGNFRVRVQTDPIGDQDQSVALLFVDSPADDVGSISWMCVQGGVQPGVRLIGSGERQPVVWRFDSDRPDTVTLEALPGASTWFVPGDRIVGFTTRAKTADRLVIRVLGSDPAEYVYDLTGSTAALNRLPCGRTPRAPADFIGQGATKERPREDAEGTYELSLVEQRPSPINTRDLLRALERNYPPLLRDSRQTGTVQARFRVMADGSVDTASIRITSSSDTAFNQATIRSLGVLRFRPAKVNGRPVRVWVELPIVWTVMDSPPPADSADSAGGRPDRPADFTGVGAAGDGTYELSAVEEIPRPLNTRDLVRALEAGYPPLLRDARVNGTVEVRFRVMADGNVDPESIHVVDSTLEAFEEPTRQAVRGLRFRPARVNGRDVNVWVTLPIVWTPPADPPANPSKSRS